MNIRDAIASATVQKKRAHDEFTDWLSKQDPEDVEAINAVLRQDRPNPSVRDLRAVLIDQGAPLTSNRLYDYRTSLRGQRVKG